MRLSEQATTILGLIATGRSYDQILQQRRELTYFDIFTAAREVLETFEVSSRTDEATTSTESVVPAIATPATSASDVSELTPPAPRLTFIDRVRATHARAWARWTLDEDIRLTSLFHLGASRASMAHELGRRPGAIRSRLLQLGLISETDEGMPGTANSGVPPLDAGTRSVGEADSAPAAVPDWEALRTRLTDEPAST